MGVNSLPKTVTRQRRGCDLNPGPAVPESSTLTTRLPTHPRGSIRVILRGVSETRFSNSKRARHLRLLACTYRIVGVNSVGRSPPLQDAVASSVCVNGRVVDTAQRQTTSSGRPSYDLQAAVRAAAFSAHSPAAELRGVAAVCKARSFIRNKMMNRPEPTCNKSTHQLQQRPFNGL